MPDIYSFDDFTVILVTKRTDDKTDLEVRIIDNGAYFYVYQTLYTSFASIHIYSHGYHHDTSDSCDDECFKMTSTDMLNEAKDFCNKLNGLDPRSPDIPYITKGTAERLLDHVKLFLYTFYL